jgi:hypothetical protein
MTPERFRQLWQDHYARVGIDEDAVHAVYLDDAILEFPQSGERFEGRETFKAWRTKYPAAVTVDLRRTVGDGDVHVAEGVVRYDGGNPLHTIAIVEFRGDKVARETIYFAAPFEAPEWRRPYAAARAEAEDRAG